MSYSKKHKVGSSFDTSSNKQPNQQQQQPPTTAYTRRPEAPANSETIMVECNRATAIQTTDGLNSDYHRWTCEFPNGIQLRTNDEIRINPCRHDHHK